MRQPLERHRRDEDRSRPRGAEERRAIVRSPTPAITRYASEIRSYAARFSRSVTSSLAPLAK
jgi:hypothetical protein